MRCREVRNHLDLYRDSELMRETELAISTHLEGCPDCAACFAADREVERRIVEAIEPPRDWTTFWEGLEHRIRKGETAFRLRPRRPMLWAASAAALLFGLMVALSWTETPRLKEAARERHAALLGGEISIEPMTPEEIVAVLREQIGVALAAIPDPHCPGHEILLRAAFPCEVDGVPAVSLVYDCCGSPLSLLVFRSGSVPEDLLPEPTFRGGIAVGGRVIAIVGGCHDRQPARLLAQRWGGVS